MEPIELVLGSNFTKNLQEVDMKLLVIFLVGVSFLMIGCPKKQEKIKTLTMWHVGSEAEAQIIENLAKKYFTPKTGIKVICDAISWSEAHTRYLTAIAGEVLPDIGTMGLTWATEFGYKGAMINLNESYPEDVKTLKSKIFPSIWNSVEWKGKVYGIPFDMTVQLLYYRSDIIPRPPKDWTELTEILKALNKENKSMMIGWGSLDWIGFSPFLWQAGGDYYDPSGTVSTLNKPEAIRALEFFASLYNQYNVPKSGENFAPAFRSGDTPLGISGNWLLNSLPYDMPELEGKWSIAMLPAGPTGKRTAFIGGRVVGIFKGSKHPDFAWEFIKFMFEENFQKEMYVEVAKTKNIFLPPNIAVWRDLPIKEDFRKVLLSQIKDAKGPPPVLGWDDSTKYIVESIQNVIIAKKNIRDELDKCNKKMNESIVK